MAICWQAMVFKSFRATVRVRGRKQSYPYGDFRQTNRRIIIIMICNTPRVRIHRSWAAAILAFLATFVLLARAVGAEVKNSNSPAANSLLKTPTSDGSPVKVSIALVLLNITDVDEVEQRYHVNAYLFMRWQDARLKYVQTPGQPDTKTYGIGEIWKPTLELINAVDSRRSVDEKLKVHADGVVKYTERFSASVTSKFALRRFPFDSQTLDLVFRPYVGDRKQFSLAADVPHSRTVPEFQTYSSLASWNVRSFRARVATADAADGGPVTEARFELSLKRESAFYVWKVILPLLLMVFLSWAVFWVETGELASQVQIVVTTVLTIIAFAFAISGSLPRVPYLTFIDKFFLTCYVFVFMAMIELMSVHLSRRSRGAELAEKIRRHSRWAVPVAFLITNIVLLLELGLA
jgi:Neurotransmitter-gated ion-channel ligand binding domain/Neurotransmitter-gated ion-channel transmembrane region